MSTNSSYNQVFRARAALKKDVTGLEAEGQTNAIKLQQKRWYLDMIQGMGWQQELRGSLSVSKCYTTVGQ